jgi:hypothetical protein
MVGTLNRCEARNLSSQRPHTLSRYIKIKRYGVRSEMPVRAMQERDFFFPALLVYLGFRDGRRITEN